MPNCNDSNRIVHLFITHLRRENKKMKKKNEKTSVGTLTNVSVNDILLFIYIFWYYVEQLEQIKRKINRKGKKRTCKNSSFAISHEHTWVLFFFFCVLSLRLCVVSFRFLCFSVYLGFAVYCRMYNCQLNVSVLLLLLLFLIEKNPKIIRTTTRWQYACELWSVLEKHRADTSFVVITSSARNRDKNTHLYCHCIRYQGNRTHTHNTRYIFRIKANIDSKRPSKLN